jgi:hypothetical protein
MSSLPARPGPAGRPGGSNCPNGSTSTSDSAAMSSRVMSNAPQFRHNRRVDHVPVLHLSWGGPAMQKTTDNSLLSIQFPTKDRVELLRPTVDLVYNSSESPSHEALRAAPSDISPRTQNAKIFDAMEARQARQGQRVLLCATSLMVRECWFLPTKIGGDRRRPGVCGVGWNCRFALIRRASGERFGRLAICHYWYQLRRNSGVC